MSDSVFSLVITVLVSVALTLAFDLTNWQGGAVGFTCGVTFGLLTVRR